MRPQRHFPVGTVERMEKLLKSTDSLAEYRRIQSIYLRAKYGYNASQIAKMVGLELQTVRNIHSAYLKAGESTLRLTGRGGRHRFNLTAEEEDALLSAFEEEGKLGHLLEVSKIHRAYEEKVGREVAKSSVYRLLQRHGWRKLVPRPRHPEGNQEAIEQFKKTSRNSLSQRRKRPAANGCLCVSCFKMKPVLVALMSLKSAGHPRELDLKSVIS